MKVSTLLVLRFSTNCNNSVAINEKQTKDKNHKNGKNQFIKDQIF